MDPIDKAIDTDIDAAIEKKHETKPQHTPTPWKMDDREDDVLIYSPWSSTVNPGNTQGYGDYRGAHVAKLESQGENAPIVSKGNAVANAAFIVRAVNCHEELVDFVKWIAAGACGQGDHGTVQCSREFVIAEAKRAVAKAEGR